jgi:hypothetical protein
MAGPSACGALLLVAAVAPSSAPVRVVLPECGTVVSLPAFVDALRVELAGGGRACCEMGSPTGDRGVEVVLFIAACDAKVGRIDVAIRNSHAGHSAAREVSLADLPADARSRALALAVAEMLREAERAPPPVPTPAPPPTADTTTRARFGGAATAELRWHASPSTALFGVRLASYLTGTHWRAGLEVAAATGGAEPPPGHISLRTFSVGAVAGPRWQLGNAALDAGVAGEIGAAFVGGTTSMVGVGVESGSGFVAIAGVRAGIEAPASGGVRVRGLLQAGGTLRGLTGDVDGVPEIGVAGAYVLAGVGVGL